MSLVHVIHRLLKLFILNLGLHTDRGCIDGNIYGGVSGGRVDKTKELPIERFWGRKNK